MANFGILSQWGPTDAHIGQGNNQISWEIQPKLSNYLRVQDIMIIRLIADINWKTPIYFAVTVSPENRIGLEDYLHMEGLVFKLKPEKSSQLNYKRMIQNITETSKKIGLQRLQPNSIALSCVRTTR